MLAGSGPQELTPLTVVDTETLKLILAHPLTPRPRGTVARLGVRSCEDAHRSEGFSPVMSLFRHQALALTPLARSSSQLVAAEIWQLAKALQGCHSGPLHTDKPSALSVPTLISKEIPPANSVFNSPQMLQYDSC